MKRKGTVALLLSLIVVLSMVAGCSKSELVTNEKAETEETMLTIGEDIDESAVEESLGVIEEAQHMVYMLTKRSSDYEGMIESYTYNYDGSLLSATFYSRQLNRLGEFYTTENEAHKTQFQYENGRISSSVFYRFGDEYSRSEYKYDDSGMLESIQYTIRGDNQEHGVRFQYDENNNAAKTLPIGNSTSEPIPEYFIPGMLYMGIFPIHIMQPDYFELDDEVHYEYSFRDDGSISTCKCYDGEQVLSEYDFDSKGRLIKLIANNNEYCLHQMAMPSYYDMRSMYEEWSFEYIDDGTIDATKKCELWDELGNETIITNYHYSDGVLDVNMQRKGNSAEYFKYLFEQNGDEMTIRVNKVDEQGFLKNEDDEIYHYQAFQVSGNTLLGIPNAIFPIAD